jgi:hypothetical protein
VIASAQIAGMLDVRSGVVAEAASGARR